MEALDRELLWQTQGKRSIVMPSCKIDQSFATFISMATPLVQIS